MKIKVFTENVRVSIEDDFALARDYFKKQANIEVEFEFQEVKLKTRKLLYAPTVSLYSVVGYNDELIPYAKDEYMAIYAFNREDFTDPTTSTQIGWIKPYISLISLATDSGYDSIGWIWKSIVHEIMHALFQKAYFAGFRGLVDQMDKSLINGTWIPYYKNDDPYAIDGNFAICFKELEPFLATLRIESVPASKRWKYFSPKEKTGDKHTISELKVELVDMLDKAREIAGTPFIVNSGFRTPKENGTAGGVNDSAHLTGEAVDIVCRTSVDRKRIIGALEKVGFNRIGIDKQFVHADISKTLPQDVIWLY